MKTGKAFDAAAVIAEALNALQGAGAGNAPGEMATRLRRCERLLVEHADQLPDASARPLQQLDMLLARVEAGVPEAVGDAEIVRLELTQRVLQLGQLIFPATGCSGKS